MTNTATNTATPQPADVPSPTKLALGVMQQAIEGGASHHEAAQTAVNYCRTMDYLDTVADTVTVHGFKALMRQDEHKKRNRLRFGLERSETVGMDTSKPMVEVTRWQADSGVVEKVGYQALGLRFNCNGRMLSIADMERGDVIFQRDLYYDHTQTNGRWASFFTALADKMPDEGCVADEVDVTDIGELAQHYQIIPS